MKKLKLQLDELAVESFTTTRADGARGTVAAYATERGTTCVGGNSCGPETCGDFACIIHTDNANVCGSGACTTGPGTGPVSGQMSCDTTCTTYDYTVNAAHDSCGFCMSFESDSPQRCRCI